MKKGLIKAFLILAVVYSAIYLTIILLATLLWNLFAESMELPRMSIWQMVLLAAVMGLLKFNWTGLYKKLEPKIPGERMNKEKAPSKSKMRFKEYVKN